jgi:gamma-glutamyl phosphate reductase
MEAKVVEVAADDLSTEYGDLRISVEIVDDVQEAVTHIHKYGR